MGLKRKAEVFAPTDGVLYVTIDTDARALRGADFSDLELLDAVFPLAYRRMRISSRDVELSDSTGSAVTAKVETRAAIGLTPELDVIFEDGVYEITRVEQRGHTYWLWLSDLVTDGTVDLMPSVTTRDSHGIPVSDSKSVKRVWCRKIAPASKRTTVDGVDSLTPSMTVRLRAIDYAGEPKLTRDGVEYSVTSTDGHGAWVDLTCSRKVSDR